MIHVQCGFSSPIIREDYSDFVRPLDLSVWAHDEASAPITLVR